MKDILRWVTHGPTPKEMMDLYSSFDWTALCGEVAKLKLERREGKLFAMPIRAVANGDGRDQSTSASILGAVLVQSWCSLGAVRGSGWNCEEKRATPTGRAAIGTTSVPLELLALSA